ncbi:MAG: DUF4433 domain-containing protein [Candidatus Competibacteraceae bacterium]
MELLLIFCAAFFICAIIIKVIDNTRKKTKYEQNNSNLLIGQASIKGEACFLKIKRNIINLVTKKNVNTKKSIKIIELFAKYGIKSLWHITHKNNINSICKIGILSNYDAHKIKPDFVDISDSSVQRWRERRDPYYQHTIHEYAPLYINPRNPMLYIRKHLQNDICIIEVCPSVLEENIYLISDGNAASKDTKLFQSINSIKHLPWGILTSDRWYDKPDGKRKMCAEVLIFPNILPKYIKSIHCYSMDTVGDIRNCGKPVVQTNNLYF